MLNLHWHWAAPVLRSVQFSFLDQKAIKADRGGNNGGLQRGLRSRANKVVTPTDHWQRTMALAKGVHNGLFLLHGNGGQYPARVSKDHEIVGNLVWPIHLRVDFGPKLEHDTPAV